MAVGTVKFFDVSKGFGFIKDDSGKEYFFHQSAVMGEGLDSLREGEGGVKHGLSEKINFEVALLKAVEASRARALDSLIKELAALADEAPEATADEKKNG